MGSDKQAADRKKAHIDLAIASKVRESSLDTRFYYEPMLSGFPQDDQKHERIVAGKKMNFPIWVSSMTGGTEQAAYINETLAKMCQKFGLGLGLGSCRQLLDSDSRLSDFDVRSVMPDQPLFTNLGIAQLIEIISKESFEQVENLQKKLKADGLIIHINPLQEWMQPEGDRYYQSPIEAIKKTINVFDFPIIVKEVGQGFGPDSLKELLQLPLEAIELGAAGGTNFSKLELMRSDDERHRVFNGVANIGHTNEEMVEWINMWSASTDIKCKQIIISGGIKGFLDGFYYMKKCEQPSIYAHASLFLKYALEGEESLYSFMEQQIEGLQMSETFLKIRKS